MRRLSDVNPDLLIIDIYLPTKNGFELARFMKGGAGVSRDRRVIFAAAPIDHVQRTGRQATPVPMPDLRKPFEASACWVGCKPCSKKRDCRSMAKEEANGLDRNSIPRSRTLRWIPPCRR